MGLVKREQKKARKWWLKHRQFSANVPFEWHPVIHGREVILRNNISDFLLQNRSSFFIRIPLWCHSINKIEEVGLENVKIAHFHTVHVSSFINSNYWFILFPQTNTIILIMSVSINHAAPTKNILQNFYKRVFSKELILTLHSA